MPTDVGLPRSNSPNTKQHWINESIEIQYYCSIKYSVLNINATDLFVCLLWLYPLITTYIFVYICGCIFNKSCLYYWRIMSVIITILIVFEFKIPIYVPFFFGRCCWRRCRCCCFWWLFAMRRRLVMWNHEYGLIKIVIYEKFTTRKSWILLNIHHDNGLWAIIIIVFSSSDHW